MGVEGNKEHHQDEAFLEFEVGRSNHRLRDTLKHPLYICHSFQQMEAARLTLEGAKEEVPSIDSFKSGGLYEDKDRLRVFTDGCKLEKGEAGFGVFFQTPILGKHAVG